MGHASRPAAGDHQPDRYDRDVLRLTPCGPRTLFAYWEASGRTRRMCGHHWQRDWNELERRLRLYDVTLLRFDGSFANGQRDIPVSGDAMHAFIRNLQPGTVYVADYGVVTQRGQFVPLLRSNAALTPRDLPPEQPDIPEREFINFSRYPYDT
jgi:hypothetical protein